MLLLLKVWYTVLITSIFYLKFCKHAKRLVSYKGDIDTFLSNFQFYFKILFIAVEKFNFNFFPNFAHCAIGPFYGPFNFTAYLLFIVGSVLSVKSES